MTKFFDAVDNWFDGHSIIAWVLTAALIVVVMALDYATKTTTAMLLLAVPGIYMMGRKGGAAQIVKFALCVGIVLFILASVASQIPCNDFGKGFHVVFGTTCH